MKIIDIALKDLRRLSRSVFSLVMMFGAPLLIAGLLYFAFSGVASGDGSYNLPATRVVAANLDQGNPSAGSINAGKMLIGFLEDEAVAEIITISSVTDEAAARHAVNTQQADVALIIPANFSEAAFAPGQDAAITLYQDPTLTIGPGIVKGLVDHFMDGFSGASIAASVTNAALQKYGGQPDPGAAQEAAVQYAAYLENSGHETTINAVSPSGQQQQEDFGAAMIGPIMASMMIFFAFYVGATGAESIIQEDEEGTLARLFTTPASRFVILAGKFVGIFITLIIQAAVLLGVSALIFNINWGQPLSAALITLGLILAATGFGVFLMSFIKTTRQTGPVIGGVLTLMGMLGGLFTNGVPNIPPLMDQVSLALPHGWALKAWKLSLAGAGADEILVPAIVMSAMGIAFFAVGLTVFRKRFA